MRDKDLCSVLTSIWEALHIISCSLDKESIDKINEPMAKIKSAIEGMGGSVDD